MNIHELPKWPQRQDSVTDQLEDLRIIANRLGFYDAADAIKQWLENNKPKTILYGCHVDEFTQNVIDKTCVIDENRHADCFYAKPGMRKEQCKEWHIVSDMTKYK